MAEKKATGEKKPKAAKKPVKAEAKAAPKRPAKPRAKAAAAPAEPAPQQAEAAAGNVSVYDADHKAVRETPLSPEVFGVRVNEHLLYEAVKQHRAGARRGTHMTKNRA